MALVRFKQASILTHINMYSSKINYFPSLISHIQVFNSHLWLVARGLDRIYIMHYFCIFSIITESFIGQSGCRLLMLSKLSCKQVPHFSRFCYGCICVFSN